MPAGKSGKKESVAYRREAAQAKIDEAHWRRVGEVLNIELRGWNYQHSASFVRPDGGLDYISGHVGARVIELIDSLTRARENV